jgi:ATP-dependent Clp protease ATP-binding subunit ClpA
MLERLSPNARSAVTSAREAAFSLGHHQVGTEHLLIGLLAQADNAAAVALAAAGASLVSVREKAVEALASRSTHVPVVGPADLPFTDRASRALDRAGRLSLRLGADQVECEHILLSVLDVEGTAGQVLRGLGVDPEAVRHLVATGSSPLEATSPSEGDPEAAPPLCGFCGTTLSLNRSTLVVGSGESSESVSVYHCATCGSAIGVEPA